MKYGSGATEEGSERHRQTSVPSWTDRVAKDRLGHLFRKFDSACKPCGLLLQTGSHTAYSVHSESIKAFRSYLMLLYLH